MDGDHSLPAITPLQSALERYKVALECLDRRGTTILPQEALEILSARNLLQKSLEAEIEIPGTIMPQVMQLDFYLKQQAYLVTEVLDLAEYRASFLPPPQAWWWNLDAIGEDPSPERLSWLWRGTRIGLWTVNLGLLGTLAARFFSGASGFVEMIAIALPSILALMQANNELTASGQEAFNRLLNKLKIPQDFYEEAKFMPAASLFLLLIVIWFAQPQMARQINLEGWEAQKKGLLIKAEQHYLKAIALAPNNLDAIYNLGSLYEELQDFDNARKYYLTAAKGGFPEAYNNLARLYIQQKKYPEAVLLLKEGLDKINEQEKGEVKLQKNLPEVKYSIFKNLGWARLKQQQNEEAYYYLLIATGISSNPDVEQYIPNPGAAHCLLAQVLEAQKNPALESWQQCYNLLEAKERKNPEEDTWFSLAQKRLTLEGRTP